MSAPLLTRLAAVPAYRSLITASILVALRDSMAEPYVVLFAVERAHLQPLMLGAFLTLRALGAVGFSMAFGLWLDRAPSLVPLRLALLAGALGFALLACTTDPLLLMLIAAGPLAASAAAFAQMFALAKRALDTAGGDTAARGTAIMRASFSAAWAVGPMVGAAIVEARDFGGLFVGSAACGAVALAAIFLGRLRAPTRALPSPEEAAEGLRNTAIGVTAAGFALFFMALVMASVALPIVITTDLHGAKGDVGLSAALCAFLEVPVMVAVAFRPRLLGGTGGLMAGFVAMALYLLAVAAAPSVDAVLAAQAFRAVGIGLVTCVGISYMQALMPDRAGAAAALFTITSQIGSLLAGLAAGEWATLFGYRSMFLACAVQAVGGLVLIALGAKPVNVREDARSHVTSSRPV